MGETAREGQEILGRGNKDGAALFRQWFSELSDVAERGEKAAYVFVMGSLSELLRSFDMPVTFPEINALQLAVRRVADDYLNQAEDHGYSPDICGYVKADYSLQLRNGDHPMGKVPAPSLAVLTNACNTYIKWGEIWERMYDIPTFTLDVPGSRQEGGQTWPGDSDFKADCAYVKAQIEELIGLCEEVSGNAFDIDRLRDILSHTNTLMRNYHRVLELNQSRPSVFNALTDGTIYLGVANGFRGRPEGARYFEELVEELEYKSSHGIGTLSDEEYRLIFVGVPCYPIFRRFSELFSDWGGVFLSSTYLWFASGGASRGFQYDLQRPLESLAEGVLISVRHAMDSMFFQNQALVDMIDPYGVDGVVYHPIKSCRTVSTGLADNRRAVMEARDIPALFIESDHMDKRVVSEAQLKNRIDAFFEGLASRKLQDAASVQEGVG